MKMRKSSRRMGRRAGVATVVAMLAVGMVATVPTGPVSAQPGDSTPPVTTATLSPHGYGAYYYDPDDTVTLTLDATDDGGDAISTVDNTAPGWTYSGWSQVNCGGCGFLGGSIHQSMTNGATAEYTFTGVGVQVFGNKTPLAVLDPGEFLGVTEVFVDDVSHGTFDYYVPTLPELTQTLLFQVTGLTYGTHTLRLQKVDGNSGNYAVHVDFLRIDSGATNSGVVSTEYRLDGGAWTAYSGPVNFDLPVGDYVVDYRSTDAAGNVEGFKTVEFGVAELPLPPLPGVPGTPFSDGNSWIYHYPDRPDPYEYSGQLWAYEPTKLTSIIADLESGWYTDRGITNIQMYGPYAATGEWRGLPATGDFMDIDPEIGTIKEWRDMVTAANARGITVTMYIAVPYIHASSPVFVKAQEDRRDNIDSFEKNIFRWDERVPQGSNPPPSHGGTGTPPSNAQVPRPSQGNWAWSPIANRWYATAWGHPAIDYASPAGMEFMKGIVRFWMDNGVQGIEWDAPTTSWGLHDSVARHRELVTYANVYRPQWENYIHAEGTGTYSNQASNDAAGYTHILLNGDDDFNSFTTQVGRIPQQRTPDSLELHWQSFHDHRRLLGRGTYSWSLYDYDVDPGLRALDAAVQAGMGAQYSIDYPMMVFNPLNTVLPESTLERVWDVHRALRKSPALRPSSSRERVATNTDLRAYSVLRRSVDSDDTSLNVYNFNNAAKCVTLNLVGTGIVVPQRTTDIATGEPGPWIRTETPTVKLPSYGWQFLDVEAENPVEWEIIDDTDPGWTYGPAWTSQADPSAYGGTRRSGNSATDGWAEYTFEGTSVQVFGRMLSNGGNMVEVFIDGVSQGVHSQRQTGSGGPFQGRRLFSATGLGEGPHTLRIQQNNGTTGQNAGGTGLDYIRVSDDVYVEGTTLPGGDRCLGDESGPTTAIDVMPPAVGGIHVGPIVAVSADDEELGSGVATIEYNLNGAGWTEYVGEVEITSFGLNTIEARSVDVAGNVGPVESETFVALPGEAQECTETIAGRHAGPVLVTEGVTCVVDAIVSGGIAVAEGASLVTGGGLVRGQLEAHGAAVVHLFGTEFQRVSITGTTGELSVAGATVNGPVVLEGNNVADHGVILRGNNFRGGLSCSTNGPLIDDLDGPNRFLVAPTGQCSDL